MASITSTSPRRAGELYAHEILDSPDFGFVKKALDGHPNSALYKSTMPLVAFYAGMKAAELGLAVQDGDLGATSEFMAGFMDGLRPPDE